MIPLNKPYFNQDDVDAVKKVMKSGWVSQGPVCEEFERAAAKYLKCKHVISVTNCTSALFLSLKALNIQPEDEVIYPDFTFPATALAIQAVGATAVPADVSFYSYNIHAKTICKVVTKKTKAIIPVHLFGRPAQMFYIMNFAKTCGLKVIEDAACALGATYGGKKIGTIGDLGCFSLHARKGITTGEGGLVATNDDDLANQVRLMSNFGVERTYKRKKSIFFLSPGCGFNFKMSDITAAIGLVQLSRIDKMIAWRRKVASAWREIIEDDKFLRDELIILPSMVGDIFQAFVVRCVHDRQRVEKYFKKKGFETGIGTYACHLFPAFYDNKKLHLINSTQLYEECLSLPIWYGLNLKKEWGKKNG